ncbi:MAG: D-alanyl-D-alanine endopeptidase [Pseudomonadota bacterium]
MINPLVGALLAAAISVSLLPVKAVAAEAALTPVSIASLIRDSNVRAPNLRSSSALLIDESEGVVLYEQNSDEQRPIASITKVMTAMVTLDAGLPMDERIRITNEDRDRLRGSKSRLPIGAVFTRRDLLAAALAASDNRAAAALGRTYPGGLEAMLRAMNEKARALGMNATRFSDTSGLSSKNVSTARDLAIMVDAANGYKTIKSLSTLAAFKVTNFAKGKARVIEFKNTNRLVRANSWDIHLSKTGYTSDAGNCLVMRTKIGSRPVTIVLLNSWGKMSRYGDSQRLRDWLMKAERRAQKQVASAA